MGIGVSLILIAVGAVLSFAVNADVRGLDINVVGWILMGVGFVGFLLALTFLDSFAGRRRVTRREYDDLP
jgi:hypothetical protein